MFFRSNNQNISLLVGGDFNLDVLSLPVLTESSSKPIVALRYKMYAVYLGSTTFSANKCYSLNGYRITRSLCASTHNSKYFFFGWVFNMWMGPHSLWHRTFSPLKLFNTDLSLIRPNSSQSGKDVKNTFLYTMDTLQVRQSSTD